MDCEKCKFYDDNCRIQIIGVNHPSYYEEIVYCILSEESQLTEEDLEIKCPLKE